MRGEGQIGWYWNVEVVEHAGVDHPIMQQPE
jgi:hypothetical protein